MLPQHLWKEEAMSNAAYFLLGMVIGTFSMVIIAVIVAERGRK